MLTAARVSPDISQCPLGVGEPPSDERKTSGVTHSRSSLSVCCVSV